ncbi:hypothetical protein S7335_5227 [Synechococcus sp. PCC 7335]|uniref:hypothetical protein n=1 Tax=Synechococcus sp. (strain ATCC 29403 / PCC 7335) TaxID=91464 RepID=UPI00017EB800|nr:hypothetical protein [Synechococcus sp. PCC 7335]EDX87517.1 hypothetical protein S7335_5227 [Synechococcus sp. PCC 7335]
MKLKRWASARKKLEEVTAGLAFLVFTASCAPANLGEVAPLSPLVESRYQVIGAAETLKSQFDPSDSEYRVGQLAYVKAAASVNAVIQQLILSLRSQTRLSDPNTAGTEDVYGLEDDIEAAIINSLSFYSFVAQSVCNQPANSSFCEEAELLSGTRSFADGLFGSTLIGLIPSISDAIIEQSIAQREADAERRAELIIHLESLLLEPFSEVGSYQNDDDFQP